MYYLQSRYYNPELCRFISADNFAYIDTYNITSINADVYCCNDHIYGSDPSGNAKSNCVIDKGTFGKWKWETKEKSYNEKQKENNSNSFSLDFGNVGDVVVFTLLLIMCLATGVEIIFLILLLTPPVGVPV